jgi:hypothetical protein
MSVDRGRHEAWDELISAGITGDVTADERRRLEAHLAECAICQATWDAFSDGRKVVSGLRHLAPPRDLGARVRGGIEAGAFARTPWWRRGPAIFAGVGGSLAVVAGALLALVLLDGNDAQVAQGTPTPAASVAPSVAPESSGPPPPSSAPTPVPSGSPAPTAPTTLPDASPDPNATPAPDATPPPALAASPEPDVYMAVTGPAEEPALTVVAGDDGEQVTDATVPVGEPIAATLSGDGQWLAVITERGLSGLQDLSLTRIADAPAAGGEPLDSPIRLGETVSLGEGVTGGPFLERLEWSHDSRYLAYTLADPATGQPDVWILDVTEGQPRRLTETGTAYAASWLPRGESDPTTRLWVSAAGEQPVSYLVELEDQALADLVPGDPAERAVAVEEDVFQPLLSPNGALVIYWQGRMAQLDGEWGFAEGGTPVLAEHRTDDAGMPMLTSARNLFSDVTIDRDAFTWAAIAWGPDGDAYAVWQAIWTGLPQADAGDYPSPTQVYFGRATDADGMNSRKALDDGDVPDGAVVIDVKVSPTGRHLLVTVAYPVAGDLETPTADLLLIERGLGDDPDVVERVNEEMEGSWFGPAAFDDPRPEDAEAP